MTDKEHSPNTERPELLSPNNPQLRVLLKSDDLTITQAALSLAQRRIDAFSEALVAHATNRAKRRPDRTILSKDVEEAIDL